MAKSDGSKMTEAELDRLLAEVDAPMPSDALMARVMADADKVLAERQAKPATPPQGAPAVMSRGWLGGALAAIGGWPAMAGLATATVAGIWIGYTQPGDLGSVAEGVLATSPGFDLGDLMPGYDTLLVEG